MNAALDLHGALAALKGVPLARLMFGPEWIQLEFIGEYAAFMQVNTRVELTTSGVNRTASFDPSGKLMQVAVAELVALRGATVERVELNQEELDVFLDGGRRLRFKLEPTAFEPVIFSGSHHMSPGQLAWHFVVTGGVRSEA
ncbi:hypothetical protein [Caenimonas aquaedulcis]|uniref:Uncharacterized protein n=1 Tax=Caenimonas aquaedulcis TaxID=2793270 RepID=A0A931H726_9BURK|nr:hypothetical protein [Caenimonas aquaedulcis]MBG9389875.1 hypothetical protein [Caenimonas aquaedulcis]